MKHVKVILLISLFLMASNAFCQYSFTSHRNKHFKKFFLTETIIPVTGFQTYDRKMREGLEKNWTFTKLKFVPASEMETYKNDKRWQFNIVFNHIKLFYHGWDYQF